MIDDKKFSPEKGRDPKHGYDSEGLTVYSHDSNGDPFHKKYYDSDGHTVNTSDLENHSHLYDSDGKELGKKDLGLAYKKAKKKEQSKKKKEKWLRD